MKRKASKLLGSIAGGAGYGSGSGGGGGGGVGREREAQTFVFLSLSGWNRRGGRFLLAHERDPFQIKRY